MTADSKTQSPLDLKTWLMEHHEVVANRWHSEVRARAGDPADPNGGLLFHFIDTLTLILPHCFGNGRDPETDIWQQAAHLYGALALRRGLAAGEVVEELQILRLVLLRLLLDALGGAGMSRGLQKDLLALNRALDASVVRASVAYTDDLCFTHLQGAVVPEGVTEDVEEEMREQLERFRQAIDHH